MIDAEELELWKSLDEARGTARYIEIRNQLIELHYCCVVWIARKMAARLKKSRVDVAELESAGVDGLIEAIDAFDHSRGIKFRTYAVLRIRGSILDWQRSIDPNVREFYTRQKKIDALGATLGREPTDDEILYELGISKHRDRRASSIDNAKRWNEVYEKDQCLRDSLLSEPKEWSINDLSPLMRGLNKQERLIVLLYFVEDCTMKQIGRELGLSESRVSQMVKAMLPRMAVSYVVSEERLSA